ncbi:MAG TPA: acetyl-CoA carboxylase biotin carboxyl carrier protein [Vicinamibacterales bacterium]|nr:acetyl-CoA carboxylase biotin carboxyl carrier protein [Vicinamibacterales bacterium]
MNVDDIKQILELVREHDLAEFELEREGLKLRVKKANDVVLTQAAPVPAAPAPAPLPPLAPLAAVPAAAAAAAEDTGVELAMIKSPIVGTFYRSPEPGAASFVEVGDTVRKGQVLCIIEAMKLMNEIESEFDGVIEKAYVENGQAVQFGDRLFAIRKP